MKFIIHLLILFSPYLGYLQVYCQKTPVLIIPKGHIGWVSGVYTPDGKQLLTYGQDINPTIWDISSARILDYLKYPKYIGDAFFLDDKKTLVTVSYDAEITYWNWKTKRIIYQLSNVRKDGSVVSVSENKKTMAILYPEGTISIWDLTGRKKLSSITAPKNAKPNSSKMAISKDGGILASSFQPAFAVFIWRVSDGKLLKKIPIETKFTPFLISFFPDGTLCIDADEPSGDSLYHRISYKPFKSFDLTYYNKISIYRDSLMVSGIEHPFLMLRTIQKSLTVSDYATGEFKFTLDHINNVACFSMLQNGQLISVDESGRIYFWNFTTGELLNTIEKKAVGMMRNLVISPDQSTAAVLRTDLFGDFFWSIFEIANQRLVAEFEKSANLLTDIFPSPNGDNIIFNEKRSIKGWEIRGSELKQAGNTESLLGYSKSSIITDYYKDNGTAFRTETPQIGYAFENWNAGWIMTAPNEHIKSVKFWDIKSLALQDSVTCEKEILAFRPDRQGNNLMVSFKDSTFTIREIKSRSGSIEYRSIGRKIIGAKYFPDGKNILFLTQNEEEDTVFLHKYDVKEKNIVSTFLLYGGEEEYFILNNGCNRVLKQNGELIDLESRKPILKVPGIGGDNRKRFSSSDSLIAYQSELGTINIFDINLRKISMVIQRPKGTVLDIAFSKNDKWLITSLDDRTVRIWDILTGKEIAAFVSFGETDFLIQIPGGYYMGTQSAAKLLHYVQGGQIISFEQLDIKYNRPDKVLEAMGCMDTALIRSYRRAYEKRIQKLGMDSTAFQIGFSVPETVITDRANIPYKFNSPSINLHIRAMDSIYILDRFNIWVNDVPIYGMKGITLRQLGKNIFDTTISINLNNGRNRIEASVLNINGTESYKSPVFVNYEPPSPQQNNIYFIGIGINQFANPSYNLTWSVKDIRDLTIKMKEHYGDDIIIDTLFDQQVTREKVLALKQHLLSLDEDDEVVISYSGHGVLSNDFDYFLSTYDISFDYPETRGLPYDDIESLLDGIRPRKKLMLIDACHSGELDKEEIAKIDQSKQKLDSAGITHKSEITIVPKKSVGMTNSFELMQSLFVNVGKGTGATIISAAGGMQYAQERGDLKNGVFTYSILEAFNNNKTLKVSELKKIVSERVTALTNGLQKPTSRNETINVDWQVW